MLSIRKSVWLVALAILISVVLVAAACGDDDTPTPATPEPTPSAPGAGATATPEPTPTPTPAKPFEGQTLIATAYAGPFYDAINEIIVPKFEEDTGGKVDFRPTFLEEIPNILAAPEDDPPYDVIVAFSPDFVRGIQEDIFLPLRRENIPNMANLTDFHSSDQGQGMDINYGIPFEMGFVVIGYNKEALGFTPTSYGDLWRPEAQGKIALGSGNMSGFIAPLALAMDFAPGFDELYTEEGRDALMEELAKLDVALWFQTNAEAAAAMERGDIAIYVEALEIVAPFVLEQPDKFGVAVPQDEVSAFMDYFGVVRGTKKRDMAEAFLNYLLDSELQGQWAERINYWMSNKDVQYGPIASQFLPESSEARESFGRMPDWGFILENWDLFEERLKKEVYTN